MHNVKPHKYFQIKIIDGEKKREVRRLFISSPHQKQETSANVKTVNDNNGGTRRRLILYCNSPGLVDN